MSVAMKVKTFHTMQISSLTPFLPVQNAPAKVVSTAQTAEPASISTPDALLMSKDVGNFFAGNSNLSLTLGKAVDLLNA